MSYAAGSMPMQICNTATSLIKCTDRTTSGTALPMTVCNNFTIHEKFDFFNPKTGLSWQINRNNRIYGSFSVAHKEPTRNNYTDGKFTEHPKAERLFYYELGYTFANSWLTFGTNLYYMDYKDQLVLTGELNEIGEAVAANVPDSYRMGIELMAGLKLCLAVSMGHQRHVKPQPCRKLYRNTFMKTKTRPATHGALIWAIPTLLFSRLSAEQPFRIHLQGV